MAVAARTPPPPSSIIPPFAKPLGDTALAYVLNTPEDEQAMLEAIGVASVEELFETIPATVRLGKALDVPPPMTEQELTDHVGELGKKNRGADAAACFLGGGAYDHFIPAVVDAIAGRGEFYTSYTPYQAEASQGNLQAFFEFQTLVCQLTGLDVANASLYDGGSAVAESALMAISITRRHGPILVARSVHPHARQTLATYATNLDATMQELDTPDGFLDPDTLRQAIRDDCSCVIVQQPNFFGCLEAVTDLADIAHQHGALFIVSVDPISLGLLTRPGDYGADIVVAEGQSLGTPLQFGGPYLGILACRQEFVRKMPGRLVGQTVDRHGNRCWVLTLQTREQHIRREKATSNICTNQGLLALRATVYLAALGPMGLRQTAELCLHKAHYAADQLASIAGIERRFHQPFFKEFTVRVPGDADRLLGRLRDLGFHAGLPLGQWYPELADCVAIAVTERRTRQEIDGLVKAFESVT